MSQDHQVTFNPISAIDRLRELDITRGFAIFGILFINALAFCYLTEKYYVLYIRWPHVLDQISYFGIRLLFQGKYYSIFSFLFGIGLAMQLERCNEKSINYKTFFFRRMLFLLVIGVIHGVFLFHGDILTVYAIAGSIVIFLISKRSFKTLLIIAVIIWMLPIGIRTISVFTSQNKTEKVQVTPEPEKKLQEKKAALMYEWGSYASGSYTDVIRRNIKNYIRQLFLNSQNLFKCLTLFMFLMGFYFGRKKLHERIEELLSKIKESYILLLIIGVIGNLVHIWTWTIIPLTSKNWDLMMLAGTISYLIGVPALSIFYLISIQLLLRKAFFKKLFSPLEAVGKMALSSYILQSILFGFIFYGYGLGLYSRVGPAFCVVFALIVFQIIIVVSNEWLKHFRFGPLEWVWRSFTYWKKQEMLIKVRLFNPEGS